MENKVFFENDTAVIYYDTELDTLFLTYKKNVIGLKNVVLICDNILAAFKQLNTQRMVVDARNMGVIGLDSQKHIKDNLIPAMVAHLKGKIFYHAQLLSPSEVFSTVAANKIKEGSEQKVGDFMIMRQFTDEEALLNWLKDSANDVRSAS